MTKSGSSLLAIRQFPAHLAHNEVGDRNRLALHFEFHGAFVFVGQAAREQRPDALAIPLPAPALKVGSGLPLARPAGAGPNGALVPIQPQPTQALEDDLDRLLRVAGLIAVLDAQNEHAARVPRIQPVE